MEDTKSTFEDVYNQIYGCGNATERLIAERLKLAHDAEMSVKDSVIKNQTILIEKIQSIMSDFNKYLVPTSSDMNLALTRIKSILV